MTTITQTPDKIAGAIATGLTASQTPGTLSVTTGGLVLSQGLVTSGATVVGTTAISFHNSSTKRPPVNLVDAAVIALDASLSNVFRLNLQANRAIGVPTNPTDGEDIRIEVLSNGHTLTLTGGVGGFRFGSDVTLAGFVLSSSKDYIYAVYDGSALKWDVVRFVRGYV